MISKGKIAQGLIILVVAGLSIMLAAGVWKGKSQKSQQEAAVTSPPDSEMKLTDMEFTEMQQGKRFWTLSASEAKYFQDQQKTLLQNVKLTFYVEKTGEEIRIESREGVLHAGSKDIELSGSIRATLPRDYIVMMDKAHYDHQKRIVKSEDPVHISGPGLNLDGRVWEYNIPEHIAQVGGGVNVSLVVDNLRIEN